MASARKTKVPVQVIRSPCVVVFREKHGERYFHCVDDESLFRIALKVLTERFKDGYWYAEPGDEPKLLDFTAEQIEAMPVSLRDDARAKLREHEHAISRYRRDLKTFEAIKKAVEGKDARAAWDAIRDRRNAEYESFTIEHLEEA